MHMLRIPLFFCILLALTAESSADPESFIDLLKAYGEDSPPRLRYRDGQDFATWQKTFQRTLEDLRGPLPKRVPLNVQTVRTERQADHTRHLIRFPVTKYSTLVAYLLIPHGISAGERRPGIVALHGHHRYGIETICGVHESDYPPYGLEAVRSGYVVIAPAWWGWPGRDGHLDRVGSRDRCNVIQMAAAMYGLNVLDLHIQDGQAAVDALMGRPEVDPKRIGCMGNSYGGRTAMWLTFFDSRIRASVPAGCMNTFRERSLKLSSCAIQYLPGLLRYGDVPELFSCIAPRPMQLHAGQGDSLITPRDRDEIKTIVEKAYRLRGAAASFEYALHKDGHTLKWSLAGPFFDKHLKQQP